MSSASLAGTAKLRSYITGIAAAAVLTALAFWLVIGSGFDRRALVVAVSVLAAVQIGVHLKYFLHLGASSEQRWNLLALIFAAWILVVLVGGTSWIMYNLRMNMG